MTFGERVKELRKEKGITQLELAEAIGLSKGTVAMWEVEKREASFTTLNKLSDYFEVPIDYLLGRSDDKSLERYRSELNHDLIGRTSEEVVGLMKDMKHLDEDHMSMVAAAIQEAFRQCVKNEKARDYYPDIDIQISSE